MPNFPVDPTKALGWELPDAWGGLKSGDLSFLNQIIRSLYHTHNPSSDLTVMGGRFVSSDLDIAPASGKYADNWVKVSGDLDIEFGQPFVSLTRPGIILAQASVAFSTGTNPIAVGDRAYAWLTPGNQFQDYLDVARLTGLGGASEVFMNLHAGFAAAGNTAVNVYFSPVIDAAGTEKLVRRGTGLEIAVIF